MEEGAGIARRRSPPPHPQIQASEEGTGVARRRSPLLHPQIHASEDGARMTCRRSGTSPVASASLPFNEDMLREILLRLPPQPSSLLRASAVCRRWRGLVTAPRFLRQFCARHRKPPLLGVFVRSNKGWGIVFSPILDPPDRVPPQRFDLGLGPRSCYDVLDCRHGLVLVKDRKRKEVIVCDPITGEHRRVAVPPDSNISFINGAVLCAAGDLGNVHGGCHSGPFKVILVSTVTRDRQPLACVYSSEAGVWGNLISTEAPCDIFGKSAVLVGNCLYWLSMSDGIVEFDLDEHSLTLIKGPPVTNDVLYENRQIIHAEDGAVGFSILSYPHFQMWQRNVNGHGVATWVPWKTVEIHTILGLPPQIEGQVGGIKAIWGYDEDTGVIFIYVDSNVYSIQLKSMQSKRFRETHHCSYYHPFISLYTPGTSIDGGSNGVEIVHNT